MLQQQKRSTRKTEISMPIVNRVADLQPDIQAWRRDIHQHPELLYEVHRTAALVAMGASRPHLLIDAEPARTPWLTPQALIEHGGIVLWRATDTLGTPPADIAQRFPGLVPEVPCGFDRLVNGRQPPLRIGWAILRGK